MDKHWIKDRLCVANYNLCNINALVQKCVVRISFTKKSLKYMYVDVKNIYFTVTPTKHVI